MDFLSKLLSNKVVFYILVALIVFTLLKVTGISFHLGVGGNGITAGVGSG